MPRPKQNKHCVSCAALILNPENIKKKGYACDACKKAGLVFFCGKCGFQKTPEGADPVTARCSRCRPAIHSLDYQDGKEAFKEDELREVFVSAFREYYTTMPHGESDLSAFLEAAFEKTKAQVLSGEATSIVAISPGNALNKYVGLITATTDPANHAIYISQAAVIKKCWGLGILKCLARSLLAQLEHLNYDKIYFIARTFNERVTKIAIDRFYFTKADDENLFPPTHSREKYGSYLCAGEGLLRLKEKLRTKDDRTPKKANKRKLSKINLSLRSGDGHSPVAGSSSDADDAAEHDFFALDQQRSSQSFHSGNPAKKRRLSKNVEESESEESDESHEEEDLGMLLGFGLFSQDRSSRLLAAPLPAAAPSSSFSSSVPFLGSSPAPPSSLSSCSSSSTRHPIPRHPSPPGVPQHQLPRKPRQPQQHQHQHQHQHQYQCQQQQQQQPQISSHLLLNPQPQAPVAFFTSEPLPAATSISLSVHFSPQQPPQTFPSQHRHPHPAPPLSFGPPSSYLPHYSHSTAHHQTTPFFVPHPGGFIHPPPPSQVLVGPTPLEDLPPLQSFSSEFPSHHDFFQDFSGPTHSTTFPTSLSSLSSSSFLQRVSAPTPAPLSFFGGGGAAVPTMPSYPPTAGYPLAVALSSQLVDHEQYYLIAPPSVRDLETDHEYSSLKSDSHSPISHSSEDLETLYQNQPPHGEEWVVSSFF